MDIGDKVRVKGTNIVAVVKAIYIGSILRDDELMASLVPPGWKHPHFASWPVSELEAVE